ncbi:MAG: hypothetical protein DRN27_04295 [Thermoplasmata archaeon]|nr:MAG: hypothetical protein DRN27_04295 [Thermoplasmata archaeon]
MQGNIDREKVISEFSKRDVRGNDEGLIPEYNVLLNQLPTEFWNQFNERISTKVNPEFKKEAERLLYNSAREYGYHTGWGIITSDEFKSVVGPMIKDEPEDILHGAYALFTAWGWAKTEIVELDPGKKMIVRAYDYYESDVVKYGKSPKMSTYMIAGISAAFMDLAYGGEYPKGFNKYDCKQTKGIECGDDFAEFVVTSKQEQNNW